MKVANKEERRGVERNEKERKQTFSLSMRATADASVTTNLPTITPNANRFLLCCLCWIGSSLHGSRKRKKDIFEFDRCQYVIELVRMSNKWKWNCLCVCCCKEKERKIGWLQTICWWRYEWESEQANKWGNHHHHHSSNERRLLTVIVG